MSLARHVQVTDTSAYIKTERLRRTAHHQRKHRRADQVPSTTFLGEGHSPSRLRYRRNSRLILPIRNQSVIYQIRTEINLLYMDHIWRQKLMYKRTIRILCFLRRSKLDSLVHTVPLHGRKVLVYLSECRILHAFNHLLGMPARERSQRPLPQTASRMSSPLKRCSVLRMSISTKFTLSLA